MKFAICTAASALALLAPPALAQDGAARNYIQVAGGVNLGGSAEISVDTATVDGSIDNDLETGLFASALAGRSFGSNMAVELEAFYFNPDIEDGDAASVLGEPLNASATSYALMANAVYRFPQFSSVTPYVGAGVGFGNVEYKVMGETDDDQGVAYQLKAGFTVPVTAGATADIGYRYLVLPKYEASEGSDRLKVETNAHIISVGMRFAF